MGEVFFVDLLPGSEYQDAALVGVPGAGPQLGCLGEVEGARAVFWEICGAVSVSGQAKYSMKEPFFT